MSQGPAARQPRMDMHAEGEEAFPLPHAVLMIRLRAAGPREMASYS